MQSFKTIASGPAILGLAMLALGACTHDSQFDETGGVQVVRSSCPAIAVPTYTGDVTLFSPPASRDASAIDVVANLTDLHGGCVEQGDQLATTASFTVQGRRSNPSGARDVVLPYFITVVRSGTIIISKQVGRVGLHFDDGKLLATTTGSVSANVSAAASSLPDNVLKRLNRKRKPTDADASIDPMADPAVKAAVQGRSFELLVGFQLTQDQLAYNATR